MNTWPVQDAKARFSELLTACLTDGPQMVTKRGTEAAVLVPMAALIPLSAGNFGVFGFAMIVVLAHTAWLASISTYVVDLVPKSILGTAFGFIAAGSAVGGILMNKSVTWTISHLSYDYCFYAMIVLHPLAFLLLWRFARQPWVLAKVRPSPT